MKHSVFSTVEFPSLCSFVVFFHSEQYSSTFNADIDMKIQPFSIKADITDICKNVNQCHSSHCLCFEKKLFSLKYIFSMLTGDSFAVGTYKYIFKKNSRC